MSDSSQCGRDRASRTGRWWQPRRGRGLRWQGLCAGIAVGVAVVGASGCGAPPTPRGARAALARYVAAIESDRPEQAYALLAAPVQERLSRAEFAEQWGEVRPELEQQARQLKRQLSRPVPVSAELTHGSGVTTRLVRQDGRWRIAQGALEPRGSSTPEEAIQTFLRAMQGQQYKVVQKLLSASMTDNVDKWLKDLAEGLDDGEIEVSGNRARLRFGSSSYVELIREDDQWKIDRLE